MFLKSDQRPRLFSPHRGEHFRARFILVLKSTLIALAFIAAYFFRFDLTIPSGYWPHILHLILPIILIKLVCFRKMGLNHGWWRYVSLADVVDIFKANVVASLAFILYVVFIYGIQGVPRSVLLLDGVFCFLSMCGVRFITRAYRENYLPFGVKNQDWSRTLIIGAGSAGQMIAREIRQNPELRKSIIGYIDDDPSKHGLKFLGSEVLGGRGHLEELVHNVQIDEVIIAIPSAQAENVRALFELCSSLNLKVKTLPGIAEILDGSVSINQVRDVSLVDLLGRKPVHLDMNMIASHLQDKRVLVTGAAGSIGSEICRQVLRFKPALIILLDNAESPLFAIEREINEKLPQAQVRAVVANIRSEASLAGVFAQFLPQVVFHAAAYKHVPLMEHNPAEAVLNNVLGTCNVADAAHHSSTERFIMISTDKAVNPSNVMGATKRAAELYVQGLSERSKTQFITVRFGNVLGSAGSVIPIFKQQIAAGGPVKVTHPEVTRFFMTIPEATQLVLQAGSMGQGGEIFLLDMGEPVRITDLAEELIHLSGFEPHKEIAITYTGLRPGEKLYEELLISSEGVKPTAHKKICIAQSTPINWYELKEYIEKLYASARINNDKDIRPLLQTIVPEYSPAENGLTPNIAEAQDGRRRVSN